MLSSLIKNRPLCIALTVGSLLYSTLFLAGICIYECPVPILFDARCPGCGLSRSIVALLHGDILSSLRWHAFTIPVLLIFFVIGIACILPQSGIKHLSSFIERSEKLTKWPYCLLILLTAYSLTRVALTF
ncbi:Protein of unknown function [Rubritalea squalenifaciens DSM 18772]|uniref:DUF2752 domain-containing protein n=2 Tax=Rubritalea TaxID=361050 RepID=A0A1M6EKS0_9BACT|nr:DUF2752 domain-containing protein [Rubritalea squalenifaciens]SHI86053.1 Protein of unknown function [Rubritalea squalenifaciens DSM 18772]